MARAAAGLSGAESAGLAYYRPLVGAWSGVYEVAATQLAPGERPPLPLLDRLRIASLPWLRRWPGPARFLTTVAIVGPAEVFHTTHVRLLGVTLLASEETIRLGPDGREFTMQGRQRMMPTPWRVRRFEGRGRIHEDARGASYEFGWLGMTMQQEARADGGVVTLEQRAPGTFGRQVLRRVGGGR